MFSESVIYVRGAFSIEFIKYLSKNIGSHLNGVLFSLPNYIIEEYVKYIWYFKK